MDKLNWKAILAGSSFDTVTFHVGVFTYLNQQNVNQYALQLFILGNLFSLLAGFIVGSIAKQHQLLNAFIAFIVSLIFMIVLSILISRPVLNYPGWYNISGLVVAPLVYLLGGYLSSLYKYKFT